MDNLKLTIELLPKGAWGNDFSKTLPKKDWDILRNISYENAKHSCKICGYETDELDAHEVWDFSIKNKTQTLKEIVALYSRCHGVKHIRNSERLGFGENAKRHFMKVNNCSEMEFASHLTNAQILFEERNMVYRWNIIADLNKFGGYGIEVKQRNIPMIDNPYEKMDWKNIKFKETINLFTFFENDNNLDPPSCYYIEVDNYQGKITVTAYFANKIDWFLDGKKIKTKFNISGKFKTELRIENLEGCELMFKLTGDGGEITSKPFKIKC